jgi:hypothetical protein
MKPAHTHVDDVFLGGGCICYFQGIAASRVQRRKREPVLTIWGGNLLIYTMPRFSYFSFIFSSFLLVKFVELGRASFSDSSMPRGLGGAGASSFPSDRTLRFFEALGALIFHSIFSNQ